MDPKKLQSVQNLAVTSLFILLLFSAGFLWGEFKKVSGIGEEQMYLQDNNDVDLVTYKTGDSPKGKDPFQSQLPALPFSRSKNDRSCINECVR